MFANMLAELATWKDGQKGPLISVQLLAKLGLDMNFIHVPNDFYVEVFWEI